MLTPSLFSNRYIHVYICNTVRYSGHIPSRQDELPSIDSCSQILLQFVIFGFNLTDVYNTFTEPINGKTSQPLRLVANRLGSSIPLESSVVYINRTPKFIIMIIRSLSAALFLFYSATANDWTLCDILITALYFPLIHYRNDCVHQFHKKQCGCL